MSNFTEHPIKYISDAVLEIVNKTPVDGLLTSGGFHSFLQNGFLFLLIYTGLRLVLGYGDVKESLTTFFKVAFISTILFSAHLGFSNFVTPAIPGTRDFLITALNKGEPSNLYESLDTLINSGAALSLAAINSFDIWHADTYPYLFYSFAIILSVIFLSILMTFIMLGAEVILRLLIAIGPFFVVSFLFHSTRNFFFMWISAVFSNIVLFVISAFFISMAAGGINKIIGDEHLVERASASEIKKGGAGNFIQNDPELQREQKAWWEERNNTKEQFDKEREDASCNILKDTIGNKTCKDIQKKYDRKFQELEKKKKAMYDKYQEKYNEAIKYADEPVNHEMYIGMILLILIFIRTTTEIPSIAQSLSGGMSAGAAAGALAGELMKTAGRKAKALTLNPVGRGMKAGAGFIAAKTIGRFLPQSPTQKLIAALKENTAAHKQSSAVPPQYDNRGSSSGGRGSPNYGNMSGHSSGNAHQSNNGGPNQGNASAKHGSDTATSRQGSDAAGSGTAARQSSDSAKQGGDAAARSRDSGITNSQQKSGDSANSGARQGGAAANARQGGGTTNNHNQINTSTHQGKPPSPATSSSAMNSAMNNNARNSDNSSPSGSQTASSSTPASTARSGTSERSQTPPPKSTTSKPESSSKPPEPPNKTSPKGNTNNEPSK